VTATGAVVPAGEGRELRAGATRPQVKVGPHLGSRLLGLLESEIPPGAGFPGHVHDEYEEVFYVLDGDMEYRLDDAWFPASAGSVVFIPPGHVHAFRNVSDREARHLAIASPADAMTMIEELLAEPARSDEILERYESRSAE
jgi:quercetin dioxygenase-like cupin family protein